MSKLLLFCIDALCSEDVTEMRQMPHFGPYLQQAAIVEKILPIWPAVTYPCHTAILTGSHAGHHGIYGNEMIRKGQINQPWFNQKADVKRPTLLDVAKEAGLTTCSLSWPVSGSADYDLNMPMIVPYGYKGWEPEPWLEESATPELLERYWHKFGRHIKGPDRSLDLFTMDLAIAILEDYEQPDVMLVKMCDLDSARHQYGVMNQPVLDQLRKHDEEFGTLVEMLRRKGTLDETNIVILGDHGQTDVDDVLLFNVLLRQAGFLTLNAAGEIDSYEAMCHSNGLSAYIEVAEGITAERFAELERYLKSLMDDPEIRLSYVMDANEAYERYRIKGDFAFIIESELPISFDERLEGETIWGSKLPGDKKIGAATHGGNPERESVTTFMAAGPAIKPGVTVARRSMIDEAPTMARMLGLEMPTADGVAITEILRS